MVFLKRIKNRISGFNTSRKCTIFSKKIRIGKKRIKIILKFDENQYLGNYGLIHYVQDKFHISFEEFRKRSHKYLPQFIIVALQEDISEKIILRFDKIHPIKELRFNMVVYHWSFGSGYENDPQIMRGSFPKGNDPGQIFIGTDYAYEFIEKIRKEPNTYREIVDYLCHELIHIFDVKHTWRIKPSRFESWNKLKGGVLQYLNFFNGFREEAHTMLILCKGETIPLKTEMFGPRIDKVISICRSLLYTKLDITYSHESDAKYVSNNLIDLFSNEIWELDNKMYHNRHYIGLLMGTMIALALLKRKGREQDVFLFNSAKQYPVSEINNLLAVSVEFHISALPDDILGDTIILVQRATLNRFIKIYDISCNVLGILPENRVITLKTFRELEDLERS